MDQIASTGKHQIILSQSIKESLSHFLGKALFDDADVFVLTDTNTHKFCLPQLIEILPAGCQQLVIGAGELNKILHTCKSLWEQLLNSGADRNSLIINLGGGLVTDIGGFVAATYMRGIRFVNIPTSLLGMVDASAGGKTGIDLDFYKNMVGLFAFPETVIVAPEFLKTLPDKEWRNGVAEMLKHSLIADERMWKKLSSALMNENHDELSVDAKNIILETLFDSIKVKAAIVTIDPYEKLERKYLNFGHTIGHAVESYSLRHDDSVRSHGEAVAIGMVSESFISSQLTGFSLDETENISKIVNALFVHQPIKKNSFQEIYQLMKSDKKSQNQNISMVLLNAVGSPVLMNDVSHEVILDALHYYNSKIK